ncbi:hypothetical protein MY10362_008417 [Beauveria mimosiformis]
MSRVLHRLSRRHLIWSTWEDRPRPEILNSLEVVCPDFDGGAIMDMAAAMAELGVKLYIMAADAAILSNWTLNIASYPDGLSSIVDKATARTIVCSGGKLQFGIWVEPATFNPQLCTLLPSIPTERFRPRATCHAGQHNQKINDAFTPQRAHGLRQQPWHPRCMPRAAASHAYMIGLYYVLGALTTGFTVVHREGCASAGGGFDAGRLPAFR